MMNDSEGVLYIANSKGTAWLEFDASGRISIFSDEAFSVRAKKDINFHSDQNINLQAAGTINMASGTKVHIDTADVAIRSSGPLALSAGGQASIMAGGNILQTGAQIHLNGPAAPEVPAITKNTLPDTAKSGTKWVSNAGALSTVVTIAPAHEPSLGVHVKTKSLAQGPR
jgi:hypothetical protein